MSDNQQQMPTPATSATEFPPPGYYEEVPKEIERPFRSIALFIGQPARDNPSAWDSCWRALFEDPRWISKTGYSLVYLPSSDTFDPSVVNLKYDKGSPDEAEEKSQAALKILTGVHFEVTHTGPHGSYYLMEWNPPWRGPVQVILPDVSVLEKIQW